MKVGQNIENQYHQALVRYGPDNQQRANKIMAAYLKREKRGKATNRMLITVRLIKSTGALRLVVNTDDLVEQVVSNVLKCYARQGRLPLLGRNNKQFTLYSAIDCSQALDPSKRIGDVGMRSFLMLRNEMNLLEKDEEKVRNRMLITVNMMRSSVTLKLVVNANDSIEGVVENALKCYARQGYLPLLGLDSKRFRLYSAIDSSQALEACQYIGDCGSWNFVMSVKQMQNCHETEKNVKCRRSFKWKHLLSSMAFKCGFCCD
ncbi:hypothetical protein SUGI_0983650 [Cryptomeria japonica]|nr:hypothetical protein SUGI_0983650 [Cryptomeria japonica]